MEQPSAEEHFKSSPSKTQLTVEEGSEDDEDNFQDACTTITDVVQALDEHNLISASLSSHAVNSHIGQQNTDTDSHDTLALLQDSLITNSHPEQIVLRSQSGYENHCSDMLNPQQNSESGESLKIMGNSRCVICTRVIISQVEQSNNKTSDEEDIVLYFIQKFLKHSLLESVRIPDVNKDQDVRKVDSINNQRLGNQCHYGLIGFCSDCHNMIHEARMLFVKINELQSKLNQIREDVVRKVVATQGTFDQQQEKECQMKNEESDGSQHCCFTSIRRLISGLSKFTLKYIK
jgi:hypothetical protein